MKIEIRILKKEDNRNTFSCGDIALDYFFQKYAGQNQFKHYIGTSYVATDGKTIFGFVTVSAGTLMRDDLPSQVRKRLPEYPLPVLKITRIGVDKRFQHKGIGKQLLKAMFRLSLEQQKMLGCIGITVDAKEDAIDFYKKLGFVELQAKRGLPKTHPSQSPMFITVKMIENASS